jgi:hypothetical protein
LQWLLSAVRRHCTCHQHLLNGAPTGCCWLWVLQHARNTCTLTKRVSGIVLPGPGPTRQATCTGTKQHLHKHAPATALLTNPSTSAQAHLHQSFKQQPVKPVKPVSLPSSEICLPVLCRPRHTLCACCTLLHRPGSTTHVGTLCSLPSSHLRPCRHVHPLPTSPNQPQQCRLYSPTHNALVCTTRPPAQNRTSSCTVPTPQKPPRPALGGVSVQADKSAVCACARRQKPQPPKPLLQRCAPLCVAEGPKLLLLGLHRHPQCAVLQAQGLNTHRDKDQGRLPPGRLPPLMPDLLFWTACMHARWSAAVTSCTPGRKPFPANHAQNPPHIVPGTLHNKNLWPCWCTDPKRVAQVSRTPFSDTKATHTQASDLATATADKSHKLPDSLLCVQGCCMHVRWACSCVLHLQQEPAHSLSSAQLDSTRLLHLSPAAVLRMQGGSLSTGV